MASKTLVVITTYNPSGNNKNYDILTKLRDGLLRNGVDILIADNSDNGVVNDLLMGWVKDKLVKVHFVRGRNPSWIVCFNSALKHIDVTPYDYVAFCVSDVLLKSDNDIKTLISDLESTGDGSIISPQVTYDGTSVPHLLGVEDKPPTECAITYSINAHFFLHDRKYLEAYRYRKSDVLIGIGTEGFIPYLCVAIGRKQYASHRVLFEHLGALEYQTGNDVYYHKTFVGTYDDFKKKIAEARFIGWEEIYQYKQFYPTGVSSPLTVYHDESLWKDGTPKELYPWCLKNLFLPDEYYDSLVTETYQ